MSQHRRRALVLKRNRYALRRLRFFGLLMLDKHDEGKGRKG